MIPGIFTGVKESCAASTLRITGILPCSFSQRAVNAGQSEIVHAGLSSSYLWHHMIDMKRGCLTNL